MGGGNSKTSREDALKLLKEDDASQPTNKVWVEEKTFAAENSLVYASSPMFNELRQMLGEPLGQKYLGEFAKSENSQENFFAWVDMEEYKSIPTPDYLHCQARNIFRKYVKDGAVMQLGGMTPERIAHYDSLINAKSEPATPGGKAAKDKVTKDLFIGLQHMVFREMVENTFKRFQRSPMYNEYLEIRKKSYNAVDVDDFEYLSFLGQGAFGAVAHVRKKSTGAEYALKVMSKRKLITDIGGSGSFAKRKERICIERDTYVNTGLFPFIVSMHYCFQTAKDAIIVMEFARGGTLHDLQGKYPNKQMNEEHAKFLFAELILALQHMHNSNYLHRDLKPINVLIDHEGHVKLADMGLVARIDDTKQAIKGMKSEAVLNINTEPEEEEEDEGRKQGNSKDGEEDGDAVPDLPAPKKQSVGKFEGRRYTRVGTMGYKAPEMLNARRPRKAADGTHENVDMGGYGESVDWWSLGVMLFEMLTGKNPFQPRIANVLESNDLEALERSAVDMIENPSSHLPAGLSQNCKDFIDGILRKDPAERLGCGSQGFRSLIQHPWFAEINFAKLLNREIPCPFEFVAKPEAKDVTPRWANFAEMSAEVDSSSLAQLMGEIVVDTITEREQEFF